MKWAKTYEIKGKIGTLVSLYVQPGASKTAIRGLYQDRLKLSVQSPPVDGAANEAVIGFLSKALKLSKSKIFLISGETSRQKNIWVECEIQTIKVLSDVLEKVQLPK